MKFRIAAINEKSLNGSIYTEECFKNLPKTIPILKTIPIYQKDYTKLICGTAVAYLEDGFVKANFSFEDKEILIDKFLCLTGFGNKSSTGYIENYDLGALYLDDNSSFKFCYKEEEEENQLMFEF